MNLKEYLSEKGITHDRFAEMLGVSARVVSKWCKGQVPAAVFTASRIHDVTNGEVSLAELAQQSFIRRAELVEQSSVCQENKGKKR